MSLCGCDWSDLGFFLELARQGRRVPAARKLRADHTTGSRRVAELQRSLNGNLFDRGADGFAITNAGQKLCKYPETTQSNAHVIEQNVAATQGGRERRL